MYIRGLDVRLTDSAYGLAIQHIDLAGSGTWPVDDVVAENRTRVAT